MTTQNTIKIVEITAPIGHGKSTLANAFERGIFGSVSIDGDVLGLAKGEALKLGGERNEFSRWRVIEAIMRGQVPIVSTGGGVFDYKGTNQFDRITKQTFGISTELTAHVPGQSYQCCKKDSDWTVELSEEDQSKLAKFSEEKQTDERNKLCMATLTNLVKPIYNETSHVCEVVKRRLADGEWTLPVSPGNQMQLDKCKTDGERVDQMDKLRKQFLNSIASLSKKNCQFALSAAYAATNVYTFPQIDYEKFKQTGVPSECVDLGSFEGANKFDEPLIGSFMQQRILTKLPTGKYHHITMAFDFKRGIKLNIDQIDELSAKYSNRKVPGTFVTLRSGKRTYTFVMVKDMESVHEDGSAHITVNSGQHAPMFTKNLTLAINSGEASIDLPLKNNKGKVTYQLHNTSSEPNNITMEEIEVELCGVFCI